MAKMEQGKYVSPKAQVILFQEDVVRTSDGSTTGEALMYWSDAWGTVGEEE